MKICSVCGHRFESDNWRCPACGRLPEFYQGYPVFAPALKAGDGSDAEYHYQELFESEAGHFWFRSRNRLLIWALRQYFPNAQNFLEIGCGTGFVLSGIRQEFPNLTLSASDTLVRGIAYAQRRLPDITFFQMDARQIPFQDEFDVIGLFDVLEHLEDDMLVLGEVLRAVKPKGGILLTVPQHPFLWSVRDDFSCHKRRYTRKELLEKVRKAGFDVLFVTSFVAVLLPALLLLRLWQRQPRDASELLDELHIHPVVSGVLEKLLMLERFFITYGVSFPAGGSLLVVAIKK